MRVRFWFLVPSVWKRPRTAKHQTRYVSRPGAEPPPDRQPVYMASDSQPPGEVGADAHSLIRLRERTVYPQLTDVPSDLRVNGARHASRESLPPSKPGRPHVVRGKQVR